MSFEQEGHGYSEGTPRCFIPDHRNMLLDTDRFAAILFGDPAVARQIHLPHDLPHWMPDSMLAAIRRKPFFLSGESMGGGRKHLPACLPAYCFVCLAVMRLA